MKRIYITIVVLTVGMFGMAYLYFSNLNTETNANDLSLNAIASNSSVVFSFENDKSFYEILGGQDLLQRILGVTKAKQFKTLRENLAGDTEISQALTGEKVYVGFTPGEGDTIDYLITTKLKPANNPLKMLTRLTAKTGLKKIGESYQINFADSTSCYIAVKDLLVVVSSSSKTANLVANGQNVLDKNFVLYIKANTTFNKNTLGSLYINFLKLPGLLKNVLNTNLTGELSILRNQNSYAALSYNFSNEKILFNGSTDINSPDNYYKLFSKLPEQKISISNILPEKTANFASYSIPNYVEWLKDFKKLTDQRKEAEKLYKNILKINQSYRVNLEDIFTKYFKNQLISFQINTGEKFGAIALKDGEKVNQLLMDLSAECAPGIRIFKESNIPYSFFGDPFKNFERPFYAIIDNYLIMANNASSVQIFLNNYSNNKLLINNEDYINFSNQLSASSTISFYINNRNSNDIIGRNIKMPFYKQYQANAGFRDFDAFCYQLSGENGRFLTNLLLYKKPQKKIASDTIQTN